MRLVECSFAGKGVALGGSAGMHAKSSTKSPVGCAESPAAALHDRIVLRHVASLETNNVPLSVDSIAV